MHVKVAYFGNDTLVELTSVYDNASGVYVNDATVSFRVLDKITRVAVSTSPTVMSNFSTLGGYRGTLGSTAAIVKRREYVAAITANAGAGLKGYWEVPFVAKVRTT